MEKDDTAVPSRSRLVRLKDDVELLLRQLVIGFWPIGVMLVLVYFMYH